MLPLKHILLFLMSFIFAVGFSQNPIDSISTKKDLIQNCKYWIIDSVSYDNIFLQKQPSKNASKSISKYLKKENCTQNEVELDEHNFRIKYNLHYSIRNLYRPEEGILEGIYVPKGVKRKYTIEVISSDKIKLTAIK